MLRLELVLDEGGSEQVLPKAAPLSLQTVGSCVTVGRKGTDVLLEDETRRVISRVHARLEHRIDGRIYIRDNNSTNGLTVNGKRVVEAAVRDGDLLRFGGARYIEIGQSAPEDHELESSNVAPTYRFCDTRGRAQKRRRAGGVPPRGSEGSESKCSLSSLEPQCSHSSAGGGSPPKQPRRAAAARAGQFELGVKDLCCSICHTLMLDPAVVSCSHGFCMPCIVAALEPMEERRCPICDEALAASPVRCWHLDEICRKAAPHLQGAELERWEERVASHVVEDAPSSEPCALAVQGGGPANAAEGEEGQVAAADEEGEAEGEEDEAPRCPSCDEPGHDEENCPYKDDEELESEMDEEDGEEDEEDEDEEDEDDEDSDEYD